MKFRLYIPIVLLLTGISIHAQTADFTGTFMNQDNSVSLQFKRVGDEIHGMMATERTSFALRAIQSANNLQGQIFGMNGPIDFGAQLNGASMALTAVGLNEIFFKTSYQHSLGEFDLTPYMVDYGRTGSVNNIPGIDTTAGNILANGDLVVTSPYPDLNNQEVFTIVAGSQLVFYQRTSYVNDNTASSITYMNFCANGTFTINYDGSFSVEGDYGGNAKGVTSGSNSGFWKLVSYQGQPAVYLQYYSGESNVNPFNINDIKQGRWRRGNTQYDLQRNKVFCN